MRRENKIKKFVDNILPIGLTNIVILMVVAYLIFTVGKTVWDNYQSNKAISKEEASLTVLEAQIQAMENEIVYYRTNSYKEKQARSKLAYVAAGEKAISVPLDIVKEPQKNEGESKADSGISVPNYFLWYDYFTR